MGYKRAGFDEIVGVDIKPQPRYPFTFVQGDALEYLTRLVSAPPSQAERRGITVETQGQANNTPRQFVLDDFDAIHASPPCQAYTSLRTSWNAKPHVGFVEETREALIASGKPWIMENVPGAPLKPSFVLCGTMFGLGLNDAELRRHRLFESNLTELALIPACAHGERVIGVYGGHGRDRRRSAPTIGVYGGGHGESRRHVRGQRNYNAAEQRKAMGIDWMTVDELSQAIPPAYTQFIGKQLLEALHD